MSETSNVTPLPIKEPPSLEDRNVSEVADFEDLVLDPTEYGIEFKNPRLTYDKSELKHLAESIAEDGVETPLQIWRTFDQDGQVRLVILGGQRRYRALKMLRDGKVKSKLKPSFFENIPIRVTEGLDANDARIKALRNNVAHESMTDYDEAVAVMEIIQGGMNQKEAAKRIGKSQTWVSRRKKVLLNACDELKTAWQAQKVPFEDALVLSAYKPEEQPAELKAYLEKRESGDLQGKSASKKAIQKKKKKPAKKGERVKPEVIESFVELGSSSKDPYVQGIRDMARFTLGELPAGKLGKAWKDHIKAAGAGKTDRK